MRTVMKKRTTEFRGLLTAMATLASRSVHGPRKVIVAEQDVSHFLNAGVDLSEIEVVRRSDNADGFTVHRLEERNDDE